MGNFVDANTVTREENKDPVADLVVPGEVLPTSIHLLPILGRPFFPAQVMPVVLSSEQWLDTVKKIGETTHHLAGLCLLRTDDIDSASPSNFHDMGTVVRMYQPGIVDNKIQFIAEGQQRFRIVEWLSRKPPFMVRVEYPEAPPKEPTEELRAYALALINTIKELIPLNPLYSEELKAFLGRFSPNQPSLLADFAAGMTSARKEELQDVLETVPLLRRMEKVLVLIKKEVDVARLQAQIRAKVEERMTDQQRKFFLREQLKEIQKELGLAKDDRTADVERFQGRIAALHLTDEAARRITEEMQKLSILETGSPEYAVTRNYLDAMTSLPWGKYSRDVLDLERSRKILDRDHDGLEDVKDRIIEFLGVGVFKGEIAGSILLLVGPPGVGKTSIGRSIADALGRKFYRFSVGGMRDEAEIKGHRRTYIGAMPGKFVQAIKESGVANPVIMLDEVDKIGDSYHGDPASALLEVLDPEQNHDFLDHFLDVRFDLSKILFVCTANQLDTIPRPLLDRMEVIRLAGYITAEKLAIARHHLWPRQLQRAGVKAGQLKISDIALRRLIEGYAREAGVRGLEQQLNRIVRKTVIKFLAGTQAPIHVGVQELEEYLGQPLFRPEKLLGGVGVAMGLAWTAMGGATLPVEASEVHTKNRGFKLTGMLGEVMRESAEIAYSYVSSHLKAFHADTEFFDEAYVHLHVPEGATPKDGPSAGITMATALLSLARNQPIKRRLAMTGELTLTGQVLPVGGIREKIIAARRSKIMELILPEGNRRDFEELPDYLQEGFTIHYASHYKDVYSKIFV